MRQRIVRQRVLGLAADHFAQELDGLVGMAERRAQPAQVDAGIEAGRVERKGGAGRALGFEEPTRDTVGGAQFKAQAGIVRCRCHSIDQDDDDILGAIQPEQDGGEQMAMGDAMRFQRDSGPRGMLRLLEQTMAKGQGGKYRLVGGTLRIGGRRLTRREEGAIEVADLHREVSDQRRSRGVGTIAADVAPAGFERAGNAANSDLEVDEAVRQGTRRRGPFDRPLEQRNRLLAGAALEQRINFSQHLGWRSSLSRLRLQACHVHRQVQRLAHVLKSTGRTPAGGGVGNMPSIAIGSVWATLSAWAAT